MQTINDYFYRSNGRHDFSKAYRETLIFQMINTFDKNHTPDDGNKERDMTLQQKRRLRNDIVRRTVKYAEEHDSASVYDTDVIVNAFFETDFGKKFANQREQFEENERQSMIDAVSSWTVGQPEDGPLRFTVSPYDPNFADSDMFDDEHDQIGYMVGENRPVYIAQNGVRKRHTGVSGASIANNTKYSPIYDYNSDGSRGKIISGYVSHVSLGQNSTVEPCTPETLTKFGDKSRMVSIYKDPTMFSGYNEIANYIKSNDNAKNVRKYFEQKVIAEQKVITEDQKKFMRDACKWLTDKGMSFDIDVTGGNTNERVVARLQGGELVTLYNAYWPKAQGEISDNRMVASVYVDTMSRPEDGLEVSNLITSADRLNAMKWYFGETVDVQARLSGSFRTGIGNENVEILKNTYGNMTVGTQGEVPVMRIAGRSVRNNTQATASKVSSGRGDPTSILLSTADYGGNMYTIRCRLDNSRQVGVYKKQVPSLPDHVFDNDGERAGEVISSNLDVKNIYPEDLIETSVSVNGIDIEGQTVTDNVPQEHRTYYRQAVANALISKWVDSAKDTYRQMFDMDKLLEEHNKMHVDDSNTAIDEAPSFNGDEDMAALQKFYWDALSGIRLSGNAKNRDSDAVAGIEALDNNIYDMPYEDRVDAVRKHFEKHIEDMFGRVPEMRKPFLSDEENAAIDERNKTAGFNPVAVAKYANTDVSGNTLQNYDYMMNMLTALGDEYRAGYLKDGSRKAEDIRRSMIKYDEESAVSVKLTDVLPYLGNEKGQALKDNAVMRTAVNRLLKGGQDVNNTVLENIYNATGQLRGRPVTTDMLAHTMMSLVKTGCRPDSIEVGVDKQGIIRYKGLYDVNLTGDKSLDIQGEIGQIFEPDEYGCIIPKFGDNDVSAKVYIPGYDAYLEANDITNPKPARDRLHLMDWRYQMKQAISSEIHESVFSNKVYYNFVPHTTDLNKVYGKSYNTQMSVEEYYDKLNPKARSAEEVKTFEACIKTLRGRCRFPNEYGAGSTTEAQSMLDHPNTLESKAYNYYYSDLNDNRNLRVLDEEYDGIFDEDMTGTARIQGLVRYLVDGAEVDSSTGKVTAVPYDDFMNPPRCALMKDSMMAGTEHDTWDRKLMSSTQILTSLRTPRHVGVAMLNLKGDTFDDGFTVSKAFAEKYKITSVDGKLRPLTAQDKLADKHGNKGVITRVVDPEQYSELMVNDIKVESAEGENMYTAEYRGDKYEFRYVKNRKDKDGNSVPIEMQAVNAVQKQLHINNDICKFFFDNPKLDIVASPYSGMSRFNGGTVRDLMSDPDDLNVKGKSIEGGMGYMDMIVVDMPADVKTHWYDVDTMREGKGRKASGQLLWVLEAARADDIISEFYGRNDRAWDNLREYAIATGFDLTEDLRPVVGYHEQTNRNEHRKLFSMPSDEAIGTINITKNGQIDKRSMLKFKNEDSFANDINVSGGFMELPFQLKFDTVKYVKSKYADICEDWFKLKKTGSYQSGGEEKFTYGLPVLPPNLIRGQETQDGVTLLNDRAKDYINIYMEAAQYRRYEMELQSCKDEDKEKFLKSMESCQSKAQIYFNNIVNDVITKHFNTKHNVIRDQCMASKIASSATAVMSAGIDLKSDEVAMSRDHAVKLGLMKYDKETDKYSWTNGKGGSVLVWRDPILRKGGVRYMNVVIDDSVIGVKINPAVDKSFDGDFDGDSVGIVALKTKAAQRQAYEKFHISSNLLDLGAKDPETGKYPLFINSGMDMTAIMAADKTGKLRAAYNTIENTANIMQSAIEKIEAGSMKIEDYTHTTITRKGGKKEKIVYTGKEAISACKKDCKRALDAFLSKAFDDIATDHIIVKNPQTVVESCQHIVDNKAKGDAGKMRSFMNNVGIDYKVDENGRADSKTAHDITCTVNDKVRVCPKIMAESVESGENKMREANKSTQAVAAYKSDNTALGGVSSQNGVSALRNKCLFEVLELTYPTTQGILSSKHDVTDAIEKDGIVRFWGKDVWDGYKLTGNWKDGDMSTIRNEPHERIRRYALDGSGQRIPIKELDEYGQYVEKRNDNGEVMYETYYEKCTKEEWIDQMKGMMCALNVNINADYIAKIANIMEHHQPEPVMRSDTRLPIMAYDAQMSERYYIADKGHKIDGVTEYSMSNGCLLDKIAYKGRMQAFANAALSNTPEYRLLCDVKAKPEGSIVGDIEANIDYYRHMQDAKYEGFDTDLGQYELKEASRAREDILESSMFVSKNVIAECAGDIYRAESGSKYNTICKEKGVKIEVEPKPIGSRANIVSLAEYANGTVRVMGESAKQYENRCKILNQPPQNKIDTMQTAVQTELQAEVLSNDGSTHISLQPVMEYNNIKKVNTSNQAANENPFAKQLQQMQNTDNYTRDYVEDNMQVVFDESELVPF